MPDFDITTVRAFLRKTKRTATAQAKPLIDILNTQLRNYEKFEAEGEDTTNLKRLILQSVDEIGKRMKEK